MRFLILIFGAFLLNSPEARADLDLMDHNPGQILECKFNKKFINGGDVIGLYVYIFDKPISFRYFSSKEGPIVANDVTYIIASIDLGDGIRFINFGTHESYPNRFELSGVVTTYIEDGVLEAANEEGSLLTIDRMSGALSEGGYRDKRMGTCLVASDSFDAFADSFSAYVDALTEDFLARRKF